MDSAIPHNPGRVGNAILPFRLPLGPADLTLLPDGVKGEGPRACHRRGRENFSLRGSQIASVRLPAGKAGGAEAPTGAPLAGAVLSCLEVWGHSQHSEGVAASRRVPQSASPRSCLCALSCPEDAQKYDLLLMGTVQQRAWDVMPVVMLRNVKVPTAPSYLGAGSSLVGRATWPGTISIF